MINATQPPRRMRFSYESRCKLVSLVLEGYSPQAAAAACGASRATGYRLWRRYQDGGWAALADRRPVPRYQPRRLSRELEQRILQAREYAKAGPLIVAGQLGLPASTVWKVLRRYGVSRLRRPARGPVVRYERSRPGELVHVDIKKLGRFWTVGKRVHGDRLTRSAHAGWQYLHLAIDVECPRFGGQLSAGLSGPAERLFGHAKEAEVPKAVSAGVSPRGGRAVRGH